MIDAYQLFHDLSFEKATFSPPTLDRQFWQDEFWDALITEYDARRLYWYIRQHHAPLYARFQTTFDQWLQDEMNHALGFQIIYSKFTQTPCDVVGLKAEKRPFDFSFMAEFIADEFNLLLTLAFDELVSTHLYAQSVAQYDSLNLACISQWVRHIKKDEANHFKHFVGIAQQHYPDRIEEAPQILNQIVELDYQNDPYAGIFLLDHKVDDIPITRQHMQAFIVPTILRQLEGVAA